ncbi:hypothetical protein O6H91_05G076200 [Diphasiastrum complanatum]|uniref:Uncharacterized protein n=2 Tax=Diphasiastrum complanatum TaxID=34168 RepID=A0ACC2DPZ2_DIPCM|nr:hypothetical protein O6H91_05G076200 [Diphasiastrum complanatum]KAJ7556255.1 hypothetical protein O6H91_05G076200 [Diphasiastrum complanatum]
MDDTYTASNGNNSAENENVRFLGKLQKNISLQTATSVEKNVPQINKLSPLRNHQLQPTSPKLENEYTNGSLNGLTRKGDNKTLCIAQNVFFNGLGVAFKLGSLLFCKAFYPKTWSVLQVLSLSQLFLDSLKPLISPLFQFPIAPLESLKWPMAALTFSKLVSFWLLPDLYRTSRFWKRLMPIYTRYMITKLHARRKSLEEKEKIWAKRHEWGGKKVHQLVLDMSGFYVKSAQILASKADFVPEAWRVRLATLLDNAPPRAFKEVKRSIQWQLSKTSCGSCLVASKDQAVPLEAVFLSVEATALAAASIAQVHGAVLKDGTRVVVKVQHAGMESIMHSDLHNLARVSKLLRGQLPVDLAPIVKEIQTTIPLEFDFEREVWFMSSIKQSLEAHGFDRIVCPMPFTELCAKRLIIMERLDGIPFTQFLQPDADEYLQRRMPELILGMQNLLQGYGQMLLLDGVFHADPHAGNLMLLPDGRLGLLDFGQSKVLDSSTRRRFANLVLAMASNEDIAIANALLGLGMLFKDVSGGEVPVSILAKMARMLFDTCYVEEATVSPMSDKSILRTTPLTSFNQALWMVVRTILLLRGLCFSLHMDVSAATIWQPYAFKATQVN